MADPTISAMSNLSLRTSTNPGLNPFPVADSWEDEESSLGSETGHESLADHTTSAMSNLSLQTSTKPGLEPLPVADSWEDEESSPRSRTGHESPTKTATGEVTGTATPPPMSKLAHQAATKVLEPLGDVDYWETKPRPLLESWKDKKVETGSDTEHETPATTAAGEVTGTATPLKPKRSLETSTKPVLKSLPVADSWEDEEVSSGSETEHEASATPATGEVTGTAAAPSTPLSPSFDEPRSVSRMPATKPAVEFGVSTSIPEAGADRRRPEKTDAVARRMIASALGIRVKLTDEQKAYDKAMREMREKSKMKRNEEREASKRQEEEAHKAKQAIWDD